MFGTLFNAVDIVALSIVFFELLMGLRRGLSGELFRLLSTLIVLVVSLRLYLPCGAFLVDNSRLADNPEMAYALAFTSLAVGLELVLFILRMILCLLAKITFNEKIDRGAGGVAGLLRGLLMAGLIVYAVGLWPQASLRELFVNNSLVGRNLFKYAPGAVEKIREIRPAVDGVQTETGDHGSHRIPGGSGGDQAQ